MFWSIIECGLGCPLFISKPSKYVTKISSYYVEYNGSCFPQKVCAIGYISNRERLGLSTVDCGVLTLGYFVPFIPSFCVMFEDSIKKLVSLQYRS